MNNIKNMVRLIAFGVALLLVSPAIIASWLEKIASSSEAVFGSFGQLFSIVPSPVGRYLRSAYYFGTLEQCSWRIHIGFGSLFVHRGAFIRERVSMGSYCVIGHADIGSDVRMASRVSVPSGKRQHLTDDGQLSQSTNYNRVNIGRGCWVGEGAIVMAHVGEHSIISAGAVVTNEMPKSTIVGGNPARVLKSLNSDSSSPSDV